ncbi:MAG: hypothetical protein KDC57_06280 [Saprospiraceae bacterium]|nr:hypothetical protein [Saprospiraceae bacterium]
MKQEEDNMIESAGEAVEYARQYIKQQGEYVRLEVAERIAKIMGPLVTLAILAGLFAIVFLIFSFGLAAWLTTLLSSATKAYFLLAGLYLLVGLVIFYFRNVLITNVVLRIVLDAFFEDEQEAKDKQNEA